MRWSLALTLPLVFQLACAGDDGDELTPSVDECSPSRTMSQPCCPELDIDACGAGLLCAALDGRTQPTCYAESSRRDGSECTDNLLCVSQSCDSKQNRCRASPGAVCEPDLGCAPDPMGYERACVESAASYACEKVNLPLESSCTFDRECHSEFCNFGKCAKQ